MVDFEKVATRPRFLLTVRLTTTFVVAVMSSQIVT
jgi:hypothetical protein